MSISGQFAEVVNGHCSGPGGGPGECCTACDVYHDFRPHLKEHRREYKAYKFAFRKLARFVTPEYLAKICAEFGVQV